MNRRIWIVGTLGIVILTASIVSIFRLKTPPPPAIAASTQFTPTDMDTEAAQECPKIPVHALETGEIYVGYWSNGGVRGFAIFKPTGQHAPTDGFVTGIDRLYAPTLDAGLEVTGHKYRMDHYGPNKCFGYLTVKEPGILAERNVDYILVTSNPDIKFNTPSDADRDAFARGFSECHPVANTADEKPRCLPDQLRSVSDLDHDGQLEFWYVYPTYYSFGLAVAEQTEPGKFSEIARDCPDCD